MKKFEIDLKWALWSGDREYWQQRGDEAAGCLATMADAFDNQGADGTDMHITSVPHKESRWGQVTIEDSVVKVAFADLWDDTMDLVNTVVELACINLTDTQYNTLETTFDGLQLAGGAGDDLIPRTGDGDNGVERAESMNMADYASLDELLEAIDDVEERLLKDSERDWNEAHERLLVTVCSVLDLPPPLWECHDCGEEFVWVLPDNTVACQTCVGLHNTGRNIIRQEVAE